MRPFLRAYLAGIALPTMVIPVVIVALALTQAAAKPTSNRRDRSVGLEPRLGSWNTSTSGSAGIARSDRRSERVCCPAPGGTGADGARPDGLDPILS